jgi:hypothetical protein
MVTFFPELVEGLSVETEVFFEEVQGSFPESRTIYPSECSICSEASSPVSLISVGDFQSVKILDAPSPIPAAS